MQHGTQWVENTEKKRPVYDSVIRSLEQCDSPTLAGLFAEDMLDLKLFLPYCSRAYVYENNSKRFHGMDNQIRRHMREKQTNQEVDWDKINLIHCDIQYQDKWNYDVIFLDTTWIQSTTLWVLERKLQYFGDKTALVLGVYSYNKERTNGLILIDKVQNIALRNGFRVSDARHITTYSTNSTRRWCEMVFAKFDFVHQRVFLR